MGEPSSGGPEGTPRAQTPSMLSLYLERSQPTQSQPSEPGQVPGPAAIESAYQAQLRRLGPAFAAAGGPPLAGSSHVARGIQSPFLGGASYGLPGPQPYLMHRPAAAVGPPASISVVSSSISLSSLPRLPAALAGQQQQPPRYARILPSHCTSLLPACPVNEPACVEVGKCSDMRKA